MHSFSSYADISISICPAMLVWLVVLASALLVPVTSLGIIHDLCIGVTLKCSSFFSLLLLLLLLPLSLSLSLSLSPSLPLSLPLLTCKIESNRSRSTTMFGACNSYMNQKTCIMQHALILEFSIMLLCDPSRHCGYMCKKSDGQAGE